MAKPKDITNQRFGRLVAIRLTDKRKNKSAVWECKCDCGNIAEVTTTNLTRGSTRSCGCLQREQSVHLGKSSGKDITGQRFGRLVAICPTDKRTSCRGVIWECKCDCGNITKVPLSYLMNGVTHSCGCLQQEAYAKLKDDVTGQRFGRLIAIRPTDKRRKTSGGVVWECQCDCGNKIEIALDYLKKGCTRSCGCLFHEKQVKYAKSIDMNKQFGMIENTSISNIKSQKPRKDSTTGYRGVSYDKAKYKYKACIGFKKKMYHLGYFDKLEDAVKIRKQAEDNLYKPFIEWYEENLAKDKNNI